MKTRAFSRLVFSFAILACGIGLTTGLHASQEPAITSIRHEGTNLVVNVRVPQGVRRITLESRERLVRGGWEPRAVARIDASVGNVVFRLPPSREVEMIRVRADFSEPLPDAFYTGTNSFYEQPNAGGSVEFFAGVFSDGSDPGRATAPEREVVESDIWKIRGQTLYFFNQLRGLQIIDLTERDKAVIRSTVELPAAGEDMYLLGSDHVVLLAGEGCGSGESEVIIVADKGGTGAIAARVPVAGRIVESRLVGRALYVASQAYRPTAGTPSTWEWGTILFSFDLAKPDAPVARGTIWRPGYGNVVAATDRLLFVITQHPTNSWQSVVAAIDITSPDGVMAPYHSLTTKGRIHDKFKVQWKDGVLTTISEDWRSSPGRTVTTRMETFRMPDPLSLGPIGVSNLGEVELGRGERLHATRFDGDRVYVVTFFQIDPLWVVDLSNPATPRIAGSVDVPGWSTFIQPLGNLLVTVGIETNRVAVSLFNVANPAVPALLSRVPLGERYSWSEANSDEQAFAVLPEAGLILVPFSGDTTNGYVSRVQLIDLAANSLALRGSIDHQFQPRRATLFADRILSLSGAELLSVDATDRDNPVVRGKLTLAWSVDRLFVQGDFVVELSTDASPILRVARAGSPNDSLGSMELGGGSVVGSASRNGHLFILQAAHAIPGGALDSTGTNSLALTVIDMGELPSLRVTGRASALVSGGVIGTEMKPVWPKPDLLVWVGGGFNRWWYQPWNPITFLADVAPSRMGWPWWGGGSGGHLVAFEVSDPAVPEFASEINLSGADRQDFSDPFAADGMVYLSHRTFDYWRVMPVSDTTMAQGDIIAPEPSPWLPRSYLHVVDYADARAPLARKPVNIPGTLKGVSHQGALLYTVGTHWTTNANSTWDEFLDVSSYDGVAARLVDSLALPSTWPRPVLVFGTNVFLGRAPAFVDTTTSSNVPSAAIETWYVANSGKLTRSGRAAIANPAQTIVNFGKLLVAQQTDTATTLFDASDGAALKKIGEGNPNGCYWFDLTRGGGDVQRGLWVPLGIYGVGRVPAGR